MDVNVSGGESPEIDWTTDDELDILPEAGPSSGSTAGNMELNASSSRYASHMNLIEHFVGMGFSTKMVAKVIEENGEGDTESILNPILTYLTLDLEDSPEQQLGTTSDLSSSDYNEVLADDPSDMENWSEDELEKLRDSLSVTRNKLNCIQTAIASAKLTERIRSALERYDSEPPESIQRYIIEQCRKWNLVWVGRNKVAPLEPDEVQMLLGFPKNHKRGGGIHRTGRYKSLRNSFQANIGFLGYTVEEAMDRCGPEANVAVLTDFICAAQMAREESCYLREEDIKPKHLYNGSKTKTNQTGNLIDFDDVQLFDGERAEKIMDTIGGFHLIIGGSPGSNQEESNPEDKDEDEDEYSVLYDTDDFQDLVDDVEFQKAELFWPTKVLNCLPKVRDQCQTTLAKISEQELYDWLDKTDNQFWDNVVSTTILDYMRINGVKEDTFPYRWMRGRKTDTPQMDEGKRIYLKEYRWIYKHTVSEELEKTPVLGLLVAGRVFEDWSHFEIYDVREDDVFHSVVIVGHGVEDGIEYYVCKNSYGTDWGYKGYFRATKYLFKHFLVIDKTSKE